MTTTTKQRVITDRVKFKMTPEEIALAGKKLTVEWRRLNEMKADHESEMASLKAQVKYAKEKHEVDLESQVRQVNELAEAVETGTEMRPVECYEKFDLVGKTVQRIRGDTQEVIRSRPMDEGEIQLAYQGELFPRPPAEAAAAEKEHRDDDAELGSDERKPRNPPGENTDA